MEARAGQYIDDRYELLSEIGRGGFGTVWQARDLEDHRKVAVKFLHAGSDNKTRRRFEVEARALARLDHPNCLRLLASGCTPSGHPYLVSEFVAGDTLSELIDARPLSDEEVLAITTQIAEALRAAHREGVTHRDLKPANIVVSPANRPPQVTVLDFGIAKLSGVEYPDVTKTGEVIGTPGYMSPEQLRGRRDIGAPSDVYCLGLIIFAMLERRPVFSGSLLEIAMAHLTQAPPRPSTGPAHLRDLTVALLAKEPESRPAIGQVLRLLHGEAEAPRSTPPSPAQIQRSGALSAAAKGAVALSVTVLVLGIAALLAPGTDEAPVEPESVTRSTSQLVGIVHGEDERAEGSGDIEGVRPAAPDVSPDLASSAVPDVEPWGVLPNARPSKGCGKKAKVGLRPVEGGWRYVPSSYDPEHPHPLVVLLHTDHQRPLDFLAATGFTDLADRDGAVLFIGDDRTDRDGGFLGVLEIVELENWRDINDDLAVMLAGMEGLRRELCIDEGRTFLVADGDGVRVGHHMACDGHVTAAAFNSWIHYRPDQAMGECRRRVPTFLSNPTRSDRLHLDGTTGCTTKHRATQRAYEEAFIGHLGCVGEGRQIFGDDEVSCVSWSCDVELVSCLIDGGKGWPGVQLSLPGCINEPRAGDFPLEDQVWAFFARAPVSK